MVQCKMQRFYRTVRQVKGRKRNNSIGGVFTSGGNWETQFLQGAALLGTREAIQNLGVARAMPAHRNNIVLLRIGNTTPRQLKQGRFANAGISERRERRAREHRLTFGAVAGDFEDDPIGQAGELDSLKLSCTEAQLVQLCKLEDGVFAYAHAHQTRYSVACSEWLVATTICLKDIDAICVGKAALASCRSRRYFRSADLQRLQLVDSIVAHANAIERLRIHGLDAMTTCNE